MKFNALSVAALAATVGAATLPAPAQADLERITIGTNPSGSVYYLLGSGFAKMFQEELGVRSTAQPHAGSTVYVPLYNNGELTLGLNNSMDSGAAVRGNPPYKSKQSNVWALARVWIIPYAYMVKADSDIKGMSDLKGRRVVTHIKAVTSLTELNSRLLATADLTADDVTAMDSGGVVKNVDLVVEGRADAAPVAYSMPAVRKAHASVPGGIRLLPLGARASDAFLNEGVPGSRTFRGTPSERRPFITEPITMAAFDAYLNAGKRVSEEDAYTLAKALHEKWKDLQKDYAPLRSVAQDEIAPANAPHPYHPGAVKYYKEAGLWPTANADNQQRLLDALGR